MIYQNKFKFFDENDINEIRIKSEICNNLDEIIRISNLIYNIHVLAECLKNFSTLFFFYPHNLFLNSLA